MTNSLQPAPPRTILTLRARVRGQESYPPGMRRPALVSLAHVRSPGGREGLPGTDDPVVVRRIGPRTDQGPGPRRNGSLPAMMHLLPTAWRGLLGREALPPAGRMPPGPGRRACVPGPWPGPSRSTRPEILLPTRVVAPERGSH